jgi:hypothetical protein
MWASDTALCQTAPIVMFYVRQSKIQPGKLAKTRQANVNLHLKIAKHHL